MLRRIGKKAFVFFIAISFLVANMCFSTFFSMNTYGMPMSVTIKSTKVNVRSGPSTEYKVLGQVSIGHKIHPLDYVKDKTGNGKYWYQFAYNDTYGYVRSDLTKESATYITDATFEASLSMQGFPDSYKEALRQLHADFPNWIFYAEDTGMDFDYAVSNELVGTKTLVNSTAISSYKSTAQGKYDWVNSKWPTFDGAAWVAASDEVTRYYMDPRNGLYDPYIFQFELQTFNQNVHTIEGVKEMVKGTFLDANVQTSGLQSAYNGTSNLINGTNQNGPVVPIIGQNNTGVSVVIGNGERINMGSTVIIPTENTMKQNNQNLEQYGPGVVNGFADTEVIGFTNAFVVPGGPGTENENKILIGNVVTSPFGPGQDIIGQQVGHISSRVIDTTGSGLGESDVETSFSFMYLPAGTYTYADLIYDACRQVNANPYVIVSMILQEQGKNGTDSVSGVNAKFPSAYNFGNVNAYAGDNYTSIENGLRYALAEGSYNRPWNTKEKGIYGLCDFYANSYVKDGQDTFYLKKWNVKGQNPFKHQYMSNVAGAFAEGQLLYNAYDDAMINMPHEFKIPIYSNLPSERCPIPTKDGSPNNKLKSLTVTGFSLTPTFDMDTDLYAIITSEDTKSVKINAEAYDKKASIGGTGNISTNTSLTVAVITVVAENGDKREYRINICKPGATDVKAVDQDNVTTPIIITGINNFGYAGPPTVMSSNVVVPKSIGVGPGQ